MAAAPAMLHDFDRLAEGSFDPLAECPLLVPDGNSDALEIWEEALKGTQQFPFMVILDVDLAYQHVKKKPIGIDEQIALAPFHLFAAGIPDDRGTKWH